MSLSRAQNIFMPANMNSIVILYRRSIKLKHDKKVLNLLPLVDQATEVILMHRHVQAMVIKTEGALA